jgi:hypothetical protein
MEAPSELVAGRREPWTPLCVNQGVVGHDAVVDLAGEEAFEAADRFAACEALLAAFGQVVDGDLIAFSVMPAERWSKLRSTNPLERVNREIARRSDVVGIYPNNAALIRLAASLLIEQNDEWLVGRRYMSEASMALVLDRDTAADTEPQQLPAAAA